MTPTQLGPLSLEFSDASLGDARLTRRLMRFADSAAQKPAASLPAQAGCNADLEGTYRLLNNEDVLPEAVFEAHTRCTVERAHAARDVFVIHDSTEFAFGGTLMREGLGWL